MNTPISRKEKNMINNSNSEYSLFVRRLLTKLGILKTKQVILCLVNAFNNINEKEAEELLFYLQKMNYLVMSKDGYVMKRMFYRDYCDDKFFDNLDQKKPYWIDFEFADVCEMYQHIIDCFWLVADMMPLSKDFALCDNVWSFVFDADLKDGKHSLYEIGYIPKDKIEITMELLKMTSQIPYDDVRECVKRIAIVDDEKMCKRIKKMGFCAIAVIDENEKKGYRIVQKRNSEEAWKDYEAK